MILLAHSVREAARCLFLRPAAGGDASVGTVSDLSSETFVAGGRGVSFGSFITFLSDGGDAGLPDRCLALIGSEHTLVLELPSRSARDAMLFRLQLFMRHHHETAARASNHQQQQSEQLWRQQSAEREQQGEEVQPEEAADHDANGTKVEAEATESGGDALDLFDANVG